MELHVKLFNAFATGNYSRKIVDVYGIFFCDFYLCLREKQMLRFQRKILDV